MIVAYIRVSTVGQGASGHGLDAQLDAVNRIATGMGQTVAVVHRDVASGSSRKGRQGLADILESLGDGDVLVVSRLDRIARSLKDFLDIREQVRLSGARLVIGDLPIPDGHYGDALTGVLAVFAELERALSRERTLEAVQARRERGEDLGGRRRGSTSVEIRTSGKAVELRSLGFSMREIAKVLAGDEHLTARGGTSWSAQQVSRLLEREKCVN